MDQPSNEEFELLATVRYDPIILATSRENAAMLGDACKLSCAPALKGTPASETQLDAEMFTPVYLPHLHLQRFFDAMGNLSWHMNLLEEERSMISSAWHFNDWICSQVRCRKQQDSVLKLRLLLSHSGKLSLQSDVLSGMACLENLFPPSLADPDSILEDATKTNAEPDIAWRHAPNWTVVLDTEPTPNSKGSLNPHLRYKSTHRPLYEAARSRIPAAKRDGLEEKRPHGTLDEILLFNEDGYVVDGSITSVYFWRDEQWVTPHVTKDHRAGALASTTKSFALAKQLCVEGDVHRDSIQANEVVWLSNAVRGFGWGTID